MYLKIDYVEREDGICVCRCYGYEEVLVIPEEIQGKPVTELYDHALASSRSARIPENMQQVILQEEERGFAEERELAGEFLKEVYLPASLRRIGNYAFYFCRNLHTLQFCGNLEDMGSGAFVWCKSLRCLIFDQISRSRNGMEHILADITWEVETRWNFLDGTMLQLTFPEYYEESVENTPARNIDTQWHGSGYKYRQCFRDQTMILKLYDDTFPYAIGNEFTDTCIRIAMNRLRFPEQLSLEAKKQYEEYIKEHIKEVLKEKIRTESLEDVRFLAEQGLLGKEDTDKAVELSSMYQKAELCSFLMDYRRQHFKAIRKSFEL